MSIRFENIKEFIGSKVVWDDRADLFTPEAGQAIRAKVEERTVLVFPQLNLTDAEQLQITNLLGEKVRLTGRFNKQDNDEDVYQVTLDEKINPQPEYVLGTFFWHMDGITVDMPPPFATLLSCRIAPDKGGETEFASTYAAYDGLPDEEKQAIEGLKAVHSVRASLSPIADAIPDDNAVDPESLLQSTEVGGLIAQWVRQLPEKVSSSGTTLNFCPADTHVMANVTTSAGSVYFIRSFWHSS